LTPVSADLDEAREWFEVLPAAMGVEGLVVKSAATRYTPAGRDAWVKVNCIEVRRVQLAGVAGVLPGHSGAQRSPIVRDRCRGRVAG
jgi:ATP-dependent DNA ligase